MKQPGVETGYRENFGSQPSAQNCPGEERPCTEAVYIDQKSLKMQKRWENTETVSKEGVH